MYDKKKKSNLFTLWSTVKVTVTTFSCLKTYNTGANPGFQVREGALKKITPSGGRRKICWGISCEKSRFYAKKNHIFSNFRGRGGGGAHAGCAPPWIRPCNIHMVSKLTTARYYKTIVFNHILNNISVLKKVVSFICGVKLQNPRHLGTDLDISVLGPGHFGTDLDISVLSTGQFGTWMRQYYLLTTIVWYLLIVNIFVLVVL
jgi:hypothetical protein